MARPIGQFARNRDRCFLIIAQIGQLGSCHTRDNYLAKILNVTEKQVQRYLKDLVRLGRIEIKTSKPLVNPTDHRFYRKRSIKVKLNLPPDFFSHKKSATFIGPAPEVPADEPLDGNDADLIAGYAKLLEEERTKKEMAAFYEALNPDRVEDPEAILREIQAELAAEGVNMELN